MKNYSHDANGTPPLGVVMAFTFDDGIEAAPQYGQPDVWAKATSLPESEDFLPARVDPPDISGPGASSPPTERLLQAKPAPAESVGSNGGAEEAAMRMAQSLFEDRPRELEDDDDFKKQLEAAVRGEGPYSDRDRAVAARAASESPSAARPSEDPFERLHPDLVSAQTYDLGTQRLVAQELDEFARDVEAEASTPAHSQLGPAYPSRRAPELDDLDMVAMLADVDQTHAPVESMPPASTEPSVAPPSEGRPPVAGAPERPPAVAPEDQPSVAVGPESRPSVDLAPEGRPSVAESPEGHPIAAMPSDGRTNDVTMRGAPPGHGGEAPDRPGETEEPVEQPAPDPQARLVHPADDEGGEP